MSGHADAHRMIGLVAADLWRELVDARALTIDGLLMVRARLIDPGAWGLLGSPGLELLRLDTEAQIAKHFRCEPDELPGNAPLPDFPPDQA